MTTSGSGDGEMCFPQKQVFRLTPSLYIQRGIYSSNFGVISVSGGK